MPVRCRNSATSYRWQGERGRSELGGIEVLVGNGVSPPAQLLELPLPILISGIVSAHLTPERQTQPGEVRSDIPCVRVASVKLARKDELRAKCRVEDGGADGTNQMVYAFGMKIAAESLELRGQKHRVRLVDLLRGPAPTGRVPPDRRVSRRDSVELGCPRSLPLVKRR